jgi:hypothetical protein
MEIEVRGRMSKKSESPFQVCVSLELAAALNQTAGPTEVAVVVVVMVVVVAAAVVPVRWQQKSVSPFHVFVFPVQIVRKHLTSASLFHVSVSLVQSVLNLKRRPLVPSSELAVAVLMPAVVSVQ